jgi:hypothetical protein
MTDSNELNEPKPLKMLCPFCSAPWTDGMMEVEAYAGGGCDTCGYGGEPHGTVTISCESCKRVIYIKEFDQRY